MKYRNEEIGLCILDYIEIITLFISSFLMLSKSDFFKLY